MTSFLSYDFEATRRVLHALAYRSKKQQKSYYKMGNCLKKNKVEPLEVKESSDTKSGRESPVKRPGSAEKAEMVKALKDEGIDSS